VSASPRCARTVFAALALLLVVAGCRGAASRAGTGAIDVYRDLLSSQWAYHCDFSPSCSRYGREAIERHGLLAGALMTADRLMRDHPLALDRYGRTPDGRPFDPVVGDGVRGALGSAPASATSVADEEVSTPVPAGDEGLFRFAERLFAGGDLDRARIEYERYLFLHPVGVRAARSRETLAVCLARLGRVDAALATLAVLSAGPRRDLVEALVLRDAGRLDAARERSARALAGAASGDELAVDARVIDGFLALEARDAALAVERFRSLPPAAARDLGARAEALDELPRRSELAAGMLSAAFPGAGQAYAGRLADGAVAFLINALLIGATVLAALEEEEVTAGVVGVVALGFYSGNIYGGVRAAENFNRDALEVHVARARGAVRQEGLAWGIAPLDDGGAVSLYFGF